jgi:hypothetical protein
MLANGGEPVWDVVALASELFARLKGGRSSRGWPARRRKAGAALITREAMAAVDAFRCLPEYARAHAKRPCF